MRRIARAALAASVFMNLLVVSARPQGPRIELFHHTSWTFADGLGAVFNIQQSPDGFLWLTTSRGVLRFDGVRFESVQQVTFGAVRDNDILSAFVASSGSVWLTTRSAGILSWKDGLLTTFTDRRCTPAGLGGGMVQEEDDDSLWFESTSGLAHLQGSSCELIGTERGYPGRLPKALLVDRDQTVWAVTLSNDLLFKPKGQKNFRHYDTLIHSSGTAVTIRQGPTGEIWIADDSGIRRLKKASSEETSPHSSARNNSPSSRDFAFAADGSVWTVTEDGVSHYSPQSVASAGPTSMERHPRVSPRSRDSVPMVFRRSHSIGKATYG
jgi:ligand-binding sensor domain-containing protein